MKRETTNRIRTVLEDWLPPIVRDSYLMRLLFRSKWGRLVDDLEQFRANIAFVSSEQYAAVYDRLPRIQHGTDNSAACIREIGKAVCGSSVLDVGCGTGYLIDALAGANPERSYTGIDFQTDQATMASRPNVRFDEGPIEALPYPDMAFDTVICTHVLEHVLDIAAAIAELRRVCRNRLILVVPREREYRFTFNPHVHFFPYEHSFLRVIRPRDERFTCKSIGRDIFYVEERAEALRAAA